MYNWVRARAAPHFHVFGGTVFNSRCVVGILRGASSRRRLGKLGNCFSLTSSSTCLSRTLTISPTFTFIYGRV